MSSVLKTSKKKLHRYIYICKAVFANTRGESPSYYNILVRYLQRFIEIECLPKFATLIHIRHCPDVFLQNSNILEYDPSNFNFSLLRHFLALGLEDRFRCLLRQLIWDVLSIEDFQEETPYIYIYVKQYLQIHGEKVLHIIIHLCGMYSVS